MTNQKGQIQVLIVILVIGLLALGGYLVYQNQSSLRQGSAGQAKPIPSIQQTSAPQEASENSMYQIVQTSISPDGLYTITYSILADHQKITITKRLEVVIFDNLLDEIGEDIWQNMQNLGLKGRGQVGYELKSWVSDSKLILRILPANGEQYETTVDAENGKIDKSNFKKIK